MSKFGMQMPAQRGKKAATPDVYTAMAVMACLFLAAACFVMFQAAGKVGPGGNPFGIQQDRIDLKP
ncbi:MAG: hypothetical protein U0637_06740 [Phycisphaerales bacterium]